MSRIIKNLCTSFLLHKQPSCSGSNVVNGLIVKQLAQQPPKLKTLMQKILVGHEQKILLFQF